MASAYGPYRIELLSKDNYDTWKLQVEALLTKNDLWEYVNGEKVKPEPVPGTADRSALTEAWIIADKKARSDLILSIHPSELSQIRGCETSRDIWLKLESIYASKGPARKATLLKQLIHQRMQDGGNMKEHIDKYFDAVNKLEGMDVQINGDLLTIMLLYSLPASFENFRCAIETRDKLPTAEELKVKIMEETEARKAGGELVTALVAKNVKPKKFRRPRREKTDEKRTENSCTTVKCYDCGVIGHKRPNCPKKKENNPSETTRQSASAVDDTYAACHMTAPIEEALRGGCGTPTRPWILDSGCTAHLCGDEESFQRIRESSRNKLNLASHAVAEIRGEGEVILNAATEQKERVVQFRNTLYVPDLRTNLVSVAKITDMGHEVIFNNRGARVMNRDGDIKLVADRRGDLYYVRENVGCAKAAITTECSELWKWHYRLGHLNTRDFARSVRDRVSSNVNLKDVDKLSHCTVCLKGKMTVLPFPKDRSPCTEPLKIVHSDVVGPYRTQAKNGARYFVTFVDDCTRWAEVYFLREKSGVLEAFKSYQAMVERVTERKIKYLQSDNGREYCNAEFDRYLDRNGIERRLTVPHTPQQNGVAERLNRTLQDMARCLMLQSGLTASFWTDAIATACYIRNRCPTSTLNGDIPFEKWTGDSLSYDNLKIFGSKVFVLDKDPTKDKLAARSFEGIFVGYPRETKGFRVWIPSKNKTIIARDVRFLEEISDIPNDSPMLDEPILENTRLSEKFSEDSSHKHVELFPTDPAATSPPIVPSDIPCEPTIQHEELKRAPGRPRLLRTGTRGRPRKLFRSETSTREAEEDLTDVVTEETVNPDDVFSGIAEISVQEAFEGEDHEEWKKAVEDEMMSLLKNDTWDIIKRSEKQNVVGCRFVLTNKYRSDGQIERYKARLVAKGYNQRFGVDYHQTFAPVARLETIRTMMALAAELKLKIWQFDVVTAYLNCHLEEEVIMEMPEMLEEMLRRIVTKTSHTSEVHSRAQTMLRMIKEGGNACHLKRALYGLRQAGRQWHTKLSQKLKSLGFKATVNEPCLYYGWRNSEIMIVTIYVDDLLVAARDKAWIQETKDQLLQDFEIKDLGPARYCLGLEIKQEDRTIELSQTGYIMALLTKYGMEDCNGVATPSEVSSRRSTARLSLDQVSVSEKWPYRELIGALMYLAVATRPDIANTISRLAQHVNDPQAEHWSAAKRVLRYLSKTSYLALVYTQTGEPIHGFSDADWASDLSNRYSYTGYVYILGGAAITWRSQKQRTIALSSTEAEYVSLSEATKEAVYLRSLFHEIGMDKYGKITLYIDNLGALYIASDPVHHARTKHIDVRCHFVREKVASGELELQHEPTTRMTADILTKALPRVSHERCLEELGMLTASLEDA